MPPVLCYHRIGGPLELGVTRVGASVFARQMSALARAGWRTQTLAEFADAPQHSRTTHYAPRTFLLTFDDGYADLACHVYPVLADLGFTATTFLITGSVGRENTWDARYTWRRLRHLDWWTIEAWGARGFDFGSHTVTHPRLTWLGDGAVADEMGRARATLVDRLGTGAGRAVAYPFGASDARVRRLAERAGYEIGFGGASGSGERLDLARAPVYVWDALDVPLGLRHDWRAVVGRVAARVAGRCAVGTSVMRAVSRPFAAVGRLTPNG